MRILFITETQQQLLQVFTHSRIFRHARAACIQLVNSLALVHRPWGYVNFVHLEGNKIEQETERIRKVSYIFQSFFN